MTAEQKEGLLQHKPRIEAQRLWDAARRGEVQLSHDGWYQTVFEATGDAELASRWASEYSRARLRAGLNVQ